MSDWEKIFEDIRAERYSQHKKWGQQNHNPATWMLILAEEFGEAAKEANEVHFREKDPKEYRAELIQTAAVAHAAVEALDRGCR